MHFEYTRFQGDRNKEQKNKGDRGVSSTIILSDAVKYKKLKTPLIVLISNDFFDEVWPTPQKQTLLPIVTSYSSKKCLHIWLGVDENDVLKKSKSLMRADGHFRRIKSNVIENEERKNVISKLQEYLYSHSASAYSLFNNYAVDDEIMEMKRNFENRYRPKSCLERDGVSARGVYMNSKSIKMDRQPSWSDEHQPSSMDSNVSDECSQGAVAGTNSASNTNNPDATTVSSNQKKKRRNRKKKSGETVDSSMQLLLSELTYGQRSGISNYLDTGQGANWKQVAQMFHVSSGDINTIFAYPPSVSKTMKLLELLNEQQPEVDVSDFVQKCKQIMRTDVSEYIQKFVSN